MLEDRPERLPHVTLIEQVAEAGNVGHVLSEQLVSQAGFAHLVVGRLGVAGAHAHAQPGGNPVGRAAHDLLDVELAVKQVRVDPSAAALKEPPILTRGALVTERARHLFSSAQRAQVPHPAERIRTEELHVVGVVLHALGHTVAIAVPAILDPGEFERALGLGPQAPQPLGVAGKLPVPVELHQATHLPVRRGLVPDLVTVREIRTKTHLPVLGRVAQELGLTQRSSQ